MTQEDKELLLKDLAARLPFGVKVLCDMYKEFDGGITSELCDVSLSKEYITVKCVITPFHFDEVKPYLRSMSSMTEEERKEFSVFIGRTERYTQQICLDADSMTNPIIGGYKCVYWGLFDKCIDWLNAHHFDYRGLIEKGLAIEAPEGMYNIKEK